MTPLFGNCRDCAAWTNWGMDQLQQPGGVCRRGPEKVGTSANDGCWSFTPRQGGSCTGCYYLGMDVAHTPCHDCCHGSPINHWTPKEPTP